MEHKLSTKTSKNDVILRVTKGTNSCGKLHFAEEAETCQVFFEMMRQETDRHKKTFYVTVGKCKLKMSYTILFYF